jgi:hypothetical protein
MKRRAHKAWRMEVSNPLEPITKWRTIFEFDDEELLTFQELGKELDQVNKPIHHRIVHNPCGVENARAAG